jgi:hypothetical protein
MLSRVLLAAACVASLLAAGWAESSATGKATLAFLKASSAGPCYAVLWDHCAGGDDVCDDPMTVTMTSASQKVLGNLNGDWNDEVDYVSLGGLKGCKLTLYQHHSWAGKALPIEITSKDIELYDVDTATFDDEMASSYSLEWVNPSPCPQGETLGGTPKAPACEKVMCPKVTTIASGTTPTLWCNDHIFESVCSVTRCAQHYKWNPDSPATMTCGATGSWSTQPRCLWSPETTVAPITARIPDCSAKLIAHGRKYESYESYSPGGGAGSGTLSGHGGGETVSSCELCADKCSLDSTCSAYVCGHDMLQCWLYDSPFPQSGSAVEGGGGDQTLRRRRNQERSSRSDVLVNPCECTAAVAADTHYGDWCWVQDATCQLARGNDKTGGHEPFVDDGKAFARVDTLANLGDCTCTANDVVASSYGEWCYVQSGHCKLKDVNDMDGTLYPMLEVLDSNIKFWARVQTLAVAPEKRGNVFCSNGRPAPTTKTTTTATTITTIGVPKWDIPFSKYRGEWVLVSQNVQLTLESVKTRTQTWSTEQLKEVTDGVNVDTEKGKESMIEFVFENTASESSNRHFNNGVTGERGENLCNSDSETNEDSSTWNIGGSRSATIGNGKASVGAELEAGYSATKGSSDTTSSEACTSAMTGSSSDSGTSNGRDSTINTMENKNHVDSIRENVAREFRSMIGETVTFSQDQTDQQSTTHVVNCATQGFGQNTYQFMITAFGDKSEADKNTTIGAESSGEPEAIQFAIPTMRFQCVDEKNNAPACPPDYCGDAECSCCKNRDFVPWWFQGEVNVCECHSDNDKKLKASGMFTKEHKEPFDTCREAATFGLCDRENDLDGFAVTVRKHCPCFCKIWDDDRTVGKGEEDNGSVNIDEAVPWTRATEPTKSNTSGSTTTVIAAVVAVVVAIVAVAATLMAVRNRRAAPADKMVVVPLESTVVVDDPSTPAAASSEHGKAYENAAP